VLFSSLLELVLARQLSAEKVKILWYAWLAQELADGLFCFQALLQPVAFMPENKM